MQILHKLVQSPRTLIIFEVAARLGSFTKAAIELKMQQPSVSAAIKQLEDILGVQLFYREHRRVALTAPGKLLYAEVAKSLTDIESALQSVVLHSRQAYVTLSTSTAFSYYWMMPRLHELREAFPEIDLRLQNSDRDPDLDVETTSLGIRLGNGTWPGHESAKLADEIIYPVASPQVMASARYLRSLPGLLNERLIHLEEPIRERPGWSQWFSHHGVPNREFGGGLRLNDYALVLQAAMAGQGFAFGWDHIVRRQLEQGTLAAKTQWSWKTGRGVFLVWPKTRPISQQAEQVRDWIISVSDYPVNRTS